MKLLIISDSYPAADRNSADFRFFNLIGMIADRYELFFCALGEPLQIERMGGAQTACYRAAMESIGVHILPDGIGNALKEHDYTAVMFEWYYPAKSLIETVRLLQPKAWIIIDSVDVVFNRLEAKTRITKAAEDRERAARTKIEELAVYKDSDIIITVTDADAEILRRESPGLVTFTIPNIHPLQEPVSITAGNSKTLIFIGSYARPGGETNIDAMRYFCEEVLPLVIDVEPEIRLRIIGAPDADEIAALASEHVQVLSFVPETEPYLVSSGISIAPLRFGGGMKGKIGEAMSYALPVVTTSTGIEGFGLESGKHVLVGDNPRAFADAIIKLLQDRNQLDQIRMAGYQFIRDHYSDVAVRERVHALFDNIGLYSIKRISWMRWSRAQARYLWQRHVAWRLDRAK